jgi:hypothetical protein
VSCVAIFELAMKSVACESGMTSFRCGAHWHMLSNLRNQEVGFGRFAAFGEACRCSQPCATNFSLTYGREY